MLEWGVVLRMGCRVGMGFCAKDGSCVRGEVVVLWRWDATPGMGCNTGDEVSFSQDAGCAITYVRTGTVGYVCMPAEPLKSPNEIRAAESEAVGYQGT